MTEQAEGLRALIERIGRMTLAEIEAELAAHDALEHDVEAPKWNLKSRLLLHRKITLKAQGAKLKR